MNVGHALKNSPKGQLRYDKNWVKDGRTKEILDEISKFSTQVALSVSPKVLSHVINSHNIDLSSTSPKLAKVSIADCNEKKNYTDTHEGRITDVYFYELQSETEIPILEYEEERICYMQEVFNSKQQEYDNFSSEMEQQVKQEYLLLKRQNELDAKRRAVDLQKIEQAILNEAIQKQQLQKEHYQSHVKKRSAKVQEAELKQKKVEEELKRKEQEQNELRLQLENCFQEAQNLVLRSIEKLNACSNFDFLCVPFNVRISESSKLLKPIIELINQPKDLELTIENILSANTQVKIAYDTFQEITLDIEQAKNKASQSCNVQHVGFSFKESIGSNDSSKVNNTKSSCDVASFPVDSSNTETLSSCKSLQKTENITDIQENEKTMKLLYQHISADMFQQYVKITKNLKDVEVIIEPLKSDPKNKKRRFELQKALNVPINSLTSSSGSQIKSKVNRLLSILNGKSPETQSEDMSSKSLVFNFCADLAARQFVKQGDSQIAAQHSTAYPIALALISVWSQKMELEPLILGHFYKVCPYLVPYYPLREEGQTDRKYYESLGYYFDSDGKIEENYKFLNRISGYMRLYAAVIVSPLPHNATSPHPHNISCGWKWLSRILNLDPQPDVTATLLFDFLDVTGHSLQKAYGKQFKKMLHILCKDFFLRIKQVSTGGSGGPVERLEIFLQQTFKKGYISPPKGILESSFWDR